MFLKNKKILVTGGNGFVGQSVVRELLRRGAKSRSIFTPRSKEFDLREASDAGKAVKGKNIIIHLAAITGGIEFHRDNPGVALYDNALINLNILEAARKEGAEKFVGLGSAAIYYKNDPLPYHEECFGRNIDLDSLHTPYNFAKLLLLVSGQAYRKQYGINVIYLVPTNMYGPGDTGKTGYVIPSLIKRILEAKEAKKPTLEVWGTGKVTRDFLYVEDAASGIVSALLKYDKPEPVNLASGKEVSMKELAETLCRLMQFNGKIVWLTDKPEGEPRRVLDTTRAKKEFGFLAKTSLEAGLRKTIEWYKKTYEGESFAVL